MLLSTYALLLQLEWKQDIHSYGYNINTTYKRTKESNRLFNKQKHNISDKTESPFINKIGSCSKNNEVLKKNPFGEKKHNNTMLKKTNKSSFQHKMLYTATRTSFFFFRGKD